jgi:hypothetical protein
VIKIRYPNITGKTPEERQKQMESYIRYLVDTLNVVLPKINNSKE